MKTGEFRGLVPNEVQMQVQENKVQLQKVLANLKRIMSELEQRAPLFEPDINRKAGINAILDIFSKVDINSSNVFAAILLETQTKLAEIFSKNPVLLTGDYSRTKVECEKLAGLFSIDCNDIKFTTTKNFEEMEMAESEEEMTWRLKFPSDEDLHNKLKNL